MTIIFVKTLLSSFLIALCTCNMTWFEAQDNCRQENKTLTLEKNHQGPSYWTGFYKKTSKWIKILGCYDKSILQYHQTYNMDSSCPGLCHDNCLEKNMTFFAIQAKKCICLSNDFNYSLHRLSPSECNYTCTNSALLTTECGGDSAYNVYLTDAILLSFNSHCLSLQCGGDPKLVEETCQSGLPQICHERPWTDFTGFLNWTQSRNECKANGTHLMANIDLSNPQSVCTNVNDSNRSPRWIGVIRDQYEKLDKGEFILKDDYTYITTCERCQLKGDSPRCEYCDCNTRQKMICSEIGLTVTPPSTTTGENDVSSKSEDVTNINIHTTERTQMHTDFSQTEFSTTVLVEVSTKPEDATSMNITEEAHLQTDRPIVEIVVPVVLALLMSACAVLIVLYFRRKKRFKDKNTDDAKKPTTMNSEYYSDIDNNINKNYFTLQQSNPSYELTDHAKIESKVESPYNEAEDGTYDHLGKKDARKQSIAADDTYNHASSVRSPDLSDYDVANNKQVHEEDNDYDHASPGENSYAHFHTSQKEETDYSEMF